MFDIIRQHPELYNLEIGACEENEIGAKVSGDLTDDKVIILKIDAYYRSSRMHNPPRSVDCLIIVKCGAEPYKD